MRMKTRENITGWLFALPAVIGFIVVNLIPMIISGYYSLCEYNAIGTPKFTGLQNYIALFGGQNPSFWPSIKATVSYAVLAVPANILFALFVAIILNSKIKGRTAFRAIFYLPCIMPMVAISFVWILLMNPEFGLFNMILEAVGINGFQWIWDEKTVIPSLVFMGIWSTGATQVIFLAGLQNIPTVYYEAAEIDGANALKKFWYITLPMLSPTIFFNLIMGVIGALQVFGQAYIMTEGGPNNASLFYVYALWRESFKYMNMGTGCAMAWIMFVFVFVVTMLIFRTQNKWVYYEGEE